MPVVVQHIVGVSDFQVFGFGGPVVHQQVVRAFHVVTRNEDKSAGDGAETVLVDAPNRFHRAAGVELKQCGRDIAHVFQFGNFFANLRGHWRAAKIDDDGGCRRLQHNVRADAFDSLRRFGQQAAGQADDKDYKSNFDGNAHRPDERAHRAVQQVAENEFAHHGLVSVGLFSGVSPTRTNSAPAGCSSLKRSAGISSFTAIFVTCNSSL